jgi:hypothetical protein
VAAVGVEEAPRRLGDLARVGDADPRADADPRSIVSGRDEKRRTKKIAPIVGARDRERAREAAGAVGPPHRASYRFRRANEHRVSFPRAVAHDVEAVVHPIDEENVRVALGTEESSRATGQTRARVTREIVRTSVRFGFDDARGADAVGRAVDDVRADERSRDDERVACVESSVGDRRERAGLRDRPRRS